MCKPVIPEMHSRVFVFCFFVFVPFLAYANAGVHSEKCFRAMLTPDCTRCQHASVRLAPTHICSQINKLANTHTHACMQMPVRPKLIRMPSVQCAAPASRHPRRAAAAQQAFQECFISLIIMFTHVCVFICWPACACASSSTSSYARTRARLKRN